MFSLNVLFQRYRVVLFKYFTRNGANFSNTDQKFTRNAAIFNNTVQMPQIQTSHIDDSGKKN